MNYFIYEGSYIYSKFVVYNDFFFQNGRGLGDLVEKLWQEIGKKKKGNETQHQQKLLI